MATYVLVHGAYQGGWIWKPVAQRLRTAGHEVYAPTLEGCGERHDQIRPGITVGTHAHEVARLLFYEDLEHVVLVGTSSGGMVICQVAELAADRIDRLVFVDALALLPTERVADLEPGMRAWALARYTPHPIAALEAPMGPTNFWDHRWKAAVIRCRQARNPPESHQRRTAERLKASYTEMDTGHYPMLSQPEELTRLLLSV